MIVASGGIGGNVELVRQSWPERLGEPPERMLCGVPDYVDGRMLGIAEAAGGTIINRDRMWHYTEGIANWSPIWSRHGIRILPGPSSIWLDTLDDVRRADLTLTVTGSDGFVLNGASTMREISRDPLDLVAQTTAMHQYPDGFVLFCGTLFAPTQDRGAPGSGFTHHVGDVVRIRSAKLGELMNRIEHSERLAPWTYGVRDLMRHLAARSSSR